MTTSTIRLSDDRMAQLRWLSDQKGLAASELVEQWIVSELEAIQGGPVVPPGFQLGRYWDNTPPLVVMYADGLKLTAMQFHEALEFADALNKLVTGEEKAAYVLDCTLYGGRVIEARRQGRGISISVDGRRKGMTYAVARDLARAIHAQTKMDSSIGATSEQQIEGKFSQSEWDEALEIAY